VNVGKELIEETHSGELKYGRQTRGSGIGGISVRRGLCTM